MKNLSYFALSFVPGIGPILARQLIERIGSAEAIFQEKTRVLEKVPGIGHTLASEIKRPEVLQRAEKELEFVEKNHIRCFFLSDEDYPRRLKECPDAPLILYYKGNADLDAKHILSIVGTRKASEYGRTLTEKLVAGIALRFPDTLIISGLAYGIDVYAHRNALANHLPTVAVLAHGLDRIYPASHRSTAVEMLGNGGLLTDFPSGIFPDRPNFLSRNRIIAGLADATVVVESRETGGSLVTADLAISYSREVFTFPGRTYDLNSKGCNNLIRANKAALITSADDLIESLGWNTRFEKKAESQQTELFFAATPEQEKVLQLLKTEGEKHINEIALRLSMPIQQLSTLLFELEMNGSVKTLPGNVYRLKN